MGKEPSRSGAEHPTNATKNRSPHVLPWEPREPHWAGMEGGLEEGTSDPLRGAQSFDMMGERTVCSGDEVGGAS